MARNDRLLSYNPADPSFGGIYWLTGRDGITNTIQAEKGWLLSITDPNGNKLSFSDAGITAKHKRRIEAQSNGFPSAG